MSHLHQKYTLKNNDDNDDANSERDAIYYENGNNNKLDETKIIFQNKSGEDLKTNKQATDVHKPCK
jgi:hypothetical protein